MSHLQDPDGKRTPGNREPMGSDVVFISEKTVIDHHNMEVCQVVNGGQ
jgi:hypothetical protein